MAASVAAVLRKIGDRLRKAIYLQDPYEGRKIAEGARRSHVLEKKHIVGWQLPQAF